MTSSPPIIEMAALMADRSTSDRRRTIADIHRSCIRTGFFVVVDHGLEDSMSALFGAAERFFASPQSDKELVPRVDRYGYIPHTGSALDRGRSSDATEYIDIGLRDECPMPAITGFEAAVRAYQHQALGVGAAILSGLATALDLRPEFFAEHMREPQCRLRLIHYPKAPLRSDGSLPVPNTPHTDYGLITLLATDGVPGLEVKPLGRGWTPVVAPAGSLVVNLGDMLARWTNHRYVSTPHRVVGSPHRERFSIPFFVNPDPGTVIACIPSCVTDESPCRYEPVTAGEFLASRIDSRTEPYIDPTEGPARTSPEGASTEDPS
jgi:isopenicillin N synthase-like dioxygenase